MNERRRKTAGSLASRTDEDVPSPVDLNTMHDALAWERTAMSKRPYRRAVFTRIESEIRRADRPVERVLELGSGPGFLAAHLLTAFETVRYVVLDCSAAMHALARLRLGPTKGNVRFVTRDFRQPGWDDGLGEFDCVVTLQAVHELRHKRHAPALHAAVRALLAPDARYLVCDHFVSDAGMSDRRLFMTADEQRDALHAGGFETVDRLLATGSLVLHRARCRTPTAL